MTEPELGPCRFCGKNSGAIVPVSWPTKYAIGCTNCNARGPSSEDKEWIYAAWNDQTSALTAAYHQGYETGIARLPALWPTVKDAE